MISSKTCKLLILKNCSTKTKSKASYLHQTRVTELNRILIYKSMIRFSTNWIAWVPGYQMMRLFLIKTQILIYNLWTLTSKWSCTMRCSKKNSKLNSKLIITNSRFKDSKKLLNNPKNQTWHHSFPTSVVEDFRPPHRLILQILKQPQEWKWLRRWSQSKKRQRLFSKLRQSRSFLISRTTKTANWTENWKEWLRPRRSQSRLCQ